MSLNINICCSPNINLVRSSVWHHYNLVLIAPVAHLLLSRIYLNQFYISLGFFLLDSKGKIILKVGFWLC